MSTPHPAVAVIGGGPAGLMAADVVSAAGRPVVVYDRMPSFGRKLLLAGRGGLNLTKDEPLATMLGHFGAARSALEPALQDFPPEALQSFAHALGQETFVGTSGRVFPRAMKASPLLRAWLARLAGRGVEFRPRHRWIGFAPDGGLRFDIAGEIRDISPPAAVLALGGASWPRLGADGSWVEMMRAAGVDVAPLSAANAGVRVDWSAHVRDRFCGAPLKRIAIAIDGERVRGEAVVTAQGLEGGAIYGLVPTIRCRLADGPVLLSIDFRPDLDIADLARRLAASRGKRSVATWLHRTLSLTPVAVALLREIDPILPAEPEALARRIKAAPVRVVGIEGLERAISTAGGVAFDAIDATYMARVRPGLFLAGEMLDWEAPTGGYLLQATFATGAAAGRGTLRWLGREA